MQPVEAGHTMPVVHARFYAPDAAEPGQTVPLPEEEAEHLTRVLRLRSGDQVRVFNGRGGEFVGRVEHAGRRGVTVAIEARADARIELPVRVMLLQALLKPDAMDAAIRDAVMIGISAIRPVVTARTEITRAALERGRRQARWARIAVSSAKQCRRATVPAVHPPVAFTEALDGIGTASPPPALMFVEPGAATKAVPLQALAAQRSAQASILIGPEGGWTADEIASVPDSVQLVTLRLPTIRASVMPLVALTALLAAWDEI